MKSSIRRDSTLVFDMDYAAVLLAALVGMTVGFFWYSRRIFTGVWSRETRKVFGPGTELKAVATTCISSILTAYFVGAMVKTAGVTTITGAVAVAAIVWLGFYVSYNVAGMAFKKTSMVHFTKKMVHHFVVLSLMSIILVLLP